MALAGLKYQKAQKKAAAIKAAAEAEAREIAYKLEEARIDREDALAAARDMTVEERMAALEAALEDVLGMAEAHVERIERTRGQQITAAHARKSINRAQVLLLSHHQSQG